MRFLLLLVVLAALQAQAPATVQEIGEPREYVSDSPAAPRFNDKYFVVKGPIHHYLSSLPESIRAQMAHSETAFYQEIPTTRVTVDDRFHFKPIAFLGAFAVACLALLLVAAIVLRNKWPQYWGEPFGVSRRFTAGVGVVALVSVLGALVSARFAYVCFDNAADRAYVVSVDGRSFNVPARSHCVVYLDSGEAEVQVVEPATSQVVDRVRIEVPAGWFEEDAPRVFFNINGANSYGFETAFYRSR